MLRFFKYTSLQWYAIPPSSNSTRFVTSLYSVGVSLFPDGVTSISLLIRPDFASVIFTGLLVPINKKQLNRLAYVDLNFSLTVISSCETRLFNLVLSSIRDKSPSCCIATSGFDLNASSAKSFEEEPRAFASNTE